MTTRARSRRPVRSLLAALLACGLLAAGAALTAAGALAAHARLQAQPGSAVLTAYQLPVREPATRPVAAARTTAAPAGDTRSLAAAGTAQSAAAPAVGGCAFWDISCEIDSWLSSLVVSALKPLLGIVARTGLSTPDLSSVPAVTGMWAGSASVADTMFVLLILAGGMIVMGYQTYQATCTLKEIAPRLVIAMVAANTSLLFIPKAISLSNAMSAALAPGLSQGSATSTLARILADGDTGSGILLILLSLVAIVLAVVVALTYIIRLMAVVLLTGAAPLALACYALPHTAWAARWWWRAFAAVLIIPCAQALVLTAAVKVFFSPGWVAAGGTSPYLLNILITICLLYVMMRIPFWISRPALQPFGPGLIRRGLGFAFGAVVLSRAGRALRGTSSGAAVAGRRGNQDGRRNGQRGARQQTASSATPRVRAARRITSPSRPARPPAPLPGGGSPAHAVPPPLPGGGTGRTARHAQPPPLPYGEDQPGTTPPLPGDPDRSRPVPPLPGGAARRAAPRLPAAGVRSPQPSRRPRQPPLPAAAVTPPGQRPTRRPGAGPPLPAASIQPAQSSRRPPQPSLPAAAVTLPGQRRQRPPLPGGTTRRGTVPPLPAAAVTPPGQRRQRPPLPGGTARRGTVPPLPAAGTRPSPGPRPGLPSAGLATSGMHAKPPPLPGGGSQQAPRHAQVPPAPPAEPPGVGAGWPGTAQRPAQEAGTPAVTGPRPRRSRPDRGTPQRRTRPAPRHEEAP